MSGGTFDMPTLLRLGLEQLRRLWMIECRGELTRSTADAIHPPWAFVRFQIFAAINDRHLTFNLGPLTAGHSRCIES